MVTIKEIAEICGVSATTVSNVLNGKAKASEKTRQKILKAVEEYGYTPNAIAQGLRNRRSKVIAVISEDIAQFTSPAIIESIVEIIVYPSVYLYYIVEGRENLCDSTLVLQRGNFYFEISKG